MASTLVALRVQLSDYQAQDAAIIAQAEWFQIAIKNKNRIQVFLNHTLEGEIGIHYRNQVVQKRESCIN